MKLCVPARWVTTYSSPVSPDTPSLRRGTRDRGPALCHPGRKPHHWQLGAPSPPAPPSLPVSHCAGHHRLVTATVCRLAFSLKPKHSPADAPGGCFVTSPRPPLSFSLHQPLPLPETQAWTEQSSSSWDRNSLEFDNKEQGGKKKAGKKKRFRMQLRGRDKTQDFQAFSLYEPGKCFHCGIASQICGVKRKMVTKLAKLL